MNFKIIKGNLVTLAKNQTFDLIAHGVNCQCRQKSGLAPQMVEAFQTNDPTLYPMEHPNLKGVKGKLGLIDHHTDDDLGLTVVNAYTQEFYGSDKEVVYLDYHALRSCFKHINDLGVRFQEKNGVTMEVGLPWIGCGRANGDRNKVYRIMCQHLTDCNVTVVEYDQQDSFNTQIDVNQTDKVLTFEDLTILSNHFSEKIDSLKDIVEGQVTGRDPVMNLESVNKDLHSHELHYSFLSYLDILRKNKEDGKPIQLPVSEVVTGVQEHPTDI